MAKSRFIQTSFASGELSPLLKGRTDLNQYYAGSSTAENVVIVPQGGLKRRAGTSVVAKVYCRLYAIRQPLQCLVVVRLVILTMVI